MLCSPAQRKTLRERCVLSSRHGTTTPNKTRWTDFHLVALWGKTSRLVSMAAAAKYGVFRGSSTACFSSYAVLLHLSEIKCLCGKSVRAWPKMSWLRPQTTGLPRLPHGTMPSEAAASSSGTSLWRGALGLFERRCAAGGHGEPRAWQRSCLANRRRRVLTIVLWCVQLSGCSNPHKGIARYGLPLLQTLKHYIVSDPFTVSSRLL